MEILIKLRADVKDAEKAIDTLHKTKDQARGLRDLGQAGKETGQALDNLSDAQKDTAKQAEHSTESHRALHMLFRLIGRESAPELGESLHAMEFGSIGGMIILGEVVSFFVKQLEEAAEKVEKLRQEQAALNTSVWEAQTKAATDAAEAAQDYADKLEDIAKSNDKVKQSESLELAVLNAKLEAQKKILEAQEKAELAAAQGDKIAQEQIRQRYSDASTAMDISGETQRIVTEGQQKFKLERDRDTLKAQSDADEAAKESALKNPDAAASQAALDAATAKQKELDDEASKYDLPNLRERLKTASTVSGEAGGESEHAALEDQIEAGEAAAKAAADNKAKVAALTNAVEEHKEAVKRATAAAEKSLKAFQDNEQAIKDLTDKIKQESAILEIHKETARTIKQIQTPPLGQALSDERGPAVSVLQGHSEKLDAAHQNLMKEIGALITGHTVSLHEAAAAIVRSTANADNFMKAVDAMNSTANAMQNFSQASAQKFAQITREMEALTQQVNNGLKQFQNRINDSFNQ
ncbi:MAG TPA: hypothetical protein VFB72_18505 [Verrucomicrobiae bacterium]|nr:hypothetical protein [Verrucomicrobiae bacterium]